MVKKQKAHKKKNPHPSPFVAALASIASLALYSLYIALLAHLLFTSLSSPKEKEQAPNRHLIEYLFPKVKQQYRSLSRHSIDPGKPAASPKKATNETYSVEQITLFIAALTTLHFIFQQTTTHPNFDSRAMQRIARRLFAQSLYKGQDLPPPTQKENLLYSPVYRLEGSSRDKEREQIAIAMHKKAANLSQNSACNLYLMPGSAINSFSLFASDPSGSIWISQGALSALNGDELLALFLREQASFPFYKRHQYQNVFWWILCLSYCLSWFFFQGQNALIRFSIGKWDPRPWHAKNGHPLYCFGLIFLILGLGGAVLSQLLSRLLKPEALAHHSDRYCARQIGSKKALISLLEKAQKKSSAEYPKALFPFFPLALHDPRYLVGMLFTQQIPKRIQRINALKLPTLFA